MSWFDKLFGEDNGSNDDYLNKRSQRRQKAKQQEKRESLLPQNNDICSMRFCTFVHSSSSSMWMIDTDTLALIFASSSVLLLCLTKFIFGINLFLVCLFTIKEANDVKKLSNKKSVNHYFHKTMTFMKDQRENFAFQ